MHDCFLCHGLKVFFEMAAHRLVGQGLHYSQLHHLVRQQAQVPMVVAFGGRLQARAIRWASARSSILGYRWAWGRSLSTPSNPPSEKRRMTLKTVPEATSKAWDTLAADQFSSVLSRMRGPGGNPGGIPPSPYHMLQLVPFLRRQLDYMLLPDYTTTSQQH